MKLFVSAIATVALVAAAGCAPAGPAKYPVRGEVKFKGQPLETGTMTLIPKSPQARTTVAQITDGNYSMQVTGGEWTVNIQAVREIGKPDPKAREVPREQYIPAKYNGESTLRITVPSDQKEFNYDLES